MIKRPSLKSRLYFYREKIKFGIFCLFSCGINAHDIYNYIIRISNHNLKNNEVKPIPINFGVNKFYCYFLNRSINLNQSREQNTQNFNFNLKLVSWIIPTFSLGVRETETHFFDISKKSLWYNSLKIDLFYIFQKKIPKYKNIYIISTEILPVTICNFYHQKKEREKIIKSFLGGNIKISLFNDTILIMSLCQKKENKINIILYKNKILIKKPKEISKKEFIKYIDIFHNILDERHVRGFKFI